MRASAQVEPPGVAGTDVPIPVQTQAEIAAALTEVLTRRMKPRRKPRRDLRPSTAGWLFLTGLGVAFLLVTLFTSADYSTWAAVLGGGQVLLGYAWIVALTSHRETKRGVACAVPPVTLYYLCQQKYARFRPLRFVATGAAIVALALLSRYALPSTRDWAGVGTPPPTPAQPVALADMPKIDQLRTLRDQKSYDRLIELLRQLTGTDEYKSAEQYYRAELAIEMKALCGHPDSGVKAAAMAAYARWGGDDARDVCLAALDRDRSDEEKERALELLPQWKHSRDAKLIAQSVAALIGRPGRVTSKATMALEEIGGVAAEEAALAQLRSAEDQMKRLVILGILEKVGGEQAMKALVGYAETNLDPYVKRRALETVEQIRNKPKKK